MCAVCILCNIWRIYSSEQPKPFDLILINIGIDLLGRNFMVCKVLRFHIIFFFFLYYLRSRLYLVQKDMIRYDTFRDNSSSSSFFRFVVVIAREEYFFFCVCLFDFQHMCGQLDFYRREKESGKIALFYSRQ